MLELKTSFSERGNGGLRNNTGLRVAQRYSRRYANVSNPRKDEWAEEGAGLSTIASQTGVCASCVAAERTCTHVQQWLQDMM